MAFPSVLAVSHYTANTWAANHPFPLPTNSTADRLLLMLGTWGGSGPTGAPSGWTEVTPKLENSVNATAFIYAKKTVGDEGATVTVTGKEDRATASTYLIDSWGGTVADHVKAILDSPTAAITAPHPTPNLNPGWGTEDALWLVASFDRNDGSNYTLATPTNYSNLERGLNSGGHYSVYTARRELKAVQENPSDWVIDTGTYHNNRWYNLVGTIAVLGGGIPIAVLQNYYAQMQG